MDETFVIVDAGGNEHEFPAGMDPKRAAAIVRGEGSGSRPNDPSMLPGRGKTITADPDTGSDEKGAFTPASFGGFVNNAVENAGGILSGIGNAIAHPINTTRAALEAKQQAEDPEAIKAELNAPDAYSQPGDRLMDSLSRVPGIIYDQPVTSALEMAPGLPVAGRAASMAKQGMVAAVKSPAMRTAAKVAGVVADHTPGLRTLRRLDRVADALLPDSAPKPAAPPSAPAVAAEGPVPGVVSAPKPAAGSKSKTAKHSENDLKVYADAKAKGASDEIAMAEMLRQRDIRKVANYEAAKAAKAAREAAAKQ